MVDFFPDRGQEELGGKSCPRFIPFYRSEEGEFQALVTDKKTFFDNIAGDEAEWAETALPLYFPQVPLALTLQS